MCVHRWYQQQIQGTNGGCCWKPYRSEQVDQGLCEQWYRTAGREKSSNSVSLIAGLALDTERCWVMLFSVHMHSKHAGRWDANVHESKNRGLWCTALVAMCFYTRLFRGTRTCADVTQSRHADAEVQRGMKEEEPFTRCFPYSTLTYMPHQDRPVWILIILIRWFAAQ